MGPSPDMTRLVSSQRDTRRQTNLQTTQAQDGGLPANRVSRLISAAKSMCTTKMPPNKASREHSVGVHTLLPERRTSPLSNKLALPSIAPPQSRESETRRTSATSSLANALRVRNTHFPEDYTYSIPDAPVWVDSPSLVDDRMPFQSPRNPAHSTKDSENACDSVCTRPFHLTPMHGGTRPLPKSLNPLTNTTFDTQNSKTITQAPKPAPRLFSSDSNLLAKPAQFPRSHGRFCLPSLSSPMLLSKDEAPQDSSSHINVKYDSSAKFLMDDLSRDSNDSQHSDISISDLEVEQDFCNEEETQSLSTLKELLGWALTPAKSQTLINSRGCNAGDYTPDDIFCPGTTTPRLDMEPEDEKEYNDIEIADNIVFQEC